MSTLALCHLLSHYVTTGDRRLGNITIEEEVTSSMSTGMCGSLPPSPSAPPPLGIQTRSQKAASLRQWTKVPLPVKLVKLLIRDLQMHIETDDCEGEVVSVPTLSFCVKLSLVLFREIVGWLKHQLVGTLG